MVSVYYDSYILYSNTIDSLKIITPKLIQELNKTGSFTFTIYPDHPYYTMLQTFKGIVTVYDDEIELFRGRIISDELGFRNEKKIVCEGELAYLLDSIQRPYEFSGTPAQLFTQYINNHNSQVDASRKFTVGNITVTDPNNYIVRSNSDYTNTWDELNKKLVNMLGGYLWIRNENGKRYIDYLADFNVLSNQDITFGQNLLDIARKVNASSFATAVIPLGARDEETGERLTIKSVNDGVDYLYNAEAVRQFGYIFMTQTWDDVTIPANLKTKGQQFIDDYAQFTASIDVSAADLKGTGVEVNSFRIGRYIKVKSEPHSLDTNFIITKLTRELDRPQNTKLTLGTTYKTLTDLQAKAMNTENQLLLRVENVENKVKKAAKGIKSSVVTYQAGTSGTTAPTGTWATKIPIVAEGQFLWTRTITSYTDDTTSTAYAVAYQGMNGINGEDGADGKDGNDGRGISSTSVTYQAGTSGTTAPTGTWSTTVPSVTSGQYLWTRTIYTFTDSTAQTVYSVGYKGTNGGAGESVSTITNYYLATSASSGVTPSTTGWTTTIQTITKDKPFLWNYEVVTGNKGTTLSSTSPVIIGHFGTNGAKGDKGVSISGIAEHYAVSNSNSIAPTKWYDTVQTMTVTDKYLWNYETISYSDGTSDDTLKRVIGAYGDTGTAGKGISIVKEQYYLSTSSTSRTGGSWVDTMPEWTNGKYIWTRSHITFSDNTTTTTTPVLAGAINSANESAANAKDKVDNMSIGSTQLLVDTNVASLTRVSHTHNKSTYRSTDENTTYEFNTISDSPVAGLTASIIFTRPEVLVNKRSVLRFNEFPLVKGETYTASVYARVISGEQMKLCGLWCANDNSSLNWTQVGPSNPIIDNTQWKRFTWTFVYNYNRYPARLLLGGIESDYAGAVEFCGFKLEKGNVATEWQLAPADMQNTVRTVDVQYYLSKSPTELSGGQWVTTAPTWENGLFIWSRTVTTLANETVIESVPVCITGAMNTAIQSDTPPRDTTLLWCDTSLSPPLMKKYDSEKGDWVVINDTTDTINQLVQDFSVSQEQTAEGILSTVSEKYYQKDAVDTLVSDVSTEIEQTKDSFTISFNQFNQNLEDLNNGTDAQFTEIKKYIRFVDGKIILGEEGNQLELQIANDRLSFLQNNSEVAYFSNNKLYVTEGEYTNSLRLGNFAFIPRANGNLSFKKIT